MTTPTTIHDPADIRLGKLFKKTDTRTLRVTSYVSPMLLPQAPLTYDVVEGQGTDWGMLGNDRYGDCTLCAYAHSVQAWSDAVGQMASISEQDVVQPYLRLSPGDQGLYVLDALNFARKTGIAGHKLKAFAEVHPTEFDYMRVALWLFGSVYLGLQLAVAHQSQDVWDVDFSPDGRPGSWGGHAVNIVAYDSQGVTLVTWGQRKRATWAFIRRYCDEAYAILGPEWFGPDGKSAEGSARLDIVRLQADLDTIDGKGPVPIDPPEPTPPTPDPSGPPPFSFSWLLSHIGRLWRWLVRGV